MSAQWSSPPGPPPPAARWQLTSPAKSYAIKTKKQFNHS